MGAAASSEEKDLPADPALPRVTANAARSILMSFGPIEVEAVMPRSISWEEMCSTIEEYCNLENESNTLRNNPEHVESLRSNYHYRAEYF